MRLSTADRLDAARLALRLGVLGPAPGRPASEAPAVRRPAHPAPRPGRDRAPLRPVQRLLRVPARPADGLLLRLLDPAGRTRLRAGRRAARQAGPDLPQARRWPRACGCSTSAAAGRRCSIHAAQHYGVHGGRGDALGAAARASACAGSAELGPAATGSRSGCRTTGRSPTSPSTPSSSIEMGEHVGQDNYPVYAAQLHRLLRPARAGCCCSRCRAGRPGPTPPRAAARSWSRYVAPDMYMRPLGSTLNFLEAAGLEVVDVHSLREHYVWTVRAVAGHAAGQPGRGGRGWSARSSTGCGCSTWPGRRWRSRRTGWACTRCWLVRPDADGRSGLPRGRSATLGARPGAAITARRATHRRAGPTARRAPAVAEPTR